MAAASAAFTPPAPREASVTISRWRKLRILARSSRLNAVRGVLRMQEVQLALNQQGRPRLLIRMLVTCIKLMIATALAATVFWLGSQVVALQQTGAPAIASMCC
jgi:hypothetical protein